jgi:hypothetical protein
VARALILRSSAERATTFCPPGALSTYNVGFKYACSMCIICIDLARGALKVAEARRSLGEMRSQLDPKHVRELEERLDKAENDPPPSGTP